MAKKRLSLQRKNIELTGLAMCFRQVVHLVEVPRNALHRLLAAAASVGDDIISENRFVDSFSQANG
jgi:hypothetical protein